MTPLQKHIDWLKKSFDCNRDFKSHACLTHAESLLQEERQMERALNMTAKEIAIGFADWIDKLSPSQKVSVWSKNREYRGLFDMDNEQLFERYLNTLK